MKKIISFILVIVGVYWLYWGNETIEKTLYTVEHPNISKNLHGMTIVQVSDLHNKSFGDKQEKLMTNIREENPDFIFVTGDIVDSRRTDLSIALTFLEEAVKLAPVYYIPGNHEARLEEYEALKTAMIDLDVTVLDNRSEQVQFQGESFTIAGIEDPTFSLASGEEHELVDHAIQQLDLDPNQFTILLSHRPELFDVYQQHSANLVFTGHAHGGQIRMPFIGGIVAPQQGFFPTYTEGVFSENDTTMIVSRGLGNSLLPLRVNNRPELVVVSLQTTDSPTSKAN